MQEAEQKQTAGENRCEQIGKVILDYTCYPGQDLYSDGDVEDQLLDIAEHVREEDLNAEIAARRDWSVLYHMSDIRENIVAALPISSKDHVLEIGAGCGAITGQLARMAEKVTCVDLSRRRSLINANRHREYDNIRILVGNFQDIEKQLTESYDCITLIGVFEYAQGYIGTEAPYVEFLRQIRRHLAPGGRIIMAIENRLGLKYWAGCREDHTGRFFEGLENYAEDSYVRTFSRPELEKIFAQVGFAHPLFYYPYPDYKLPMVIHSDDCLPEAGSLHRQIYHFDRDRMTLFDEKAVLDSLMTSGQYPLFANSYLVILQDETPVEKGEPSADLTDPAGRDNFRVIYSKFSVERDPRFAIRTDMEMDSAGHRRVVKRAVSSQADVHVTEIAANSRRLAKLFEGTKIHINRVTEVSGDGQAPADDSTRSGAAASHVILEYIGGEKTLESRLNELVAAGRQEEAFCELRELTQLLRQNAQVPWKPSAVFEEMFGSNGNAVLHRQGYFSASVTDLDMVPENLLIRPDGDWDLIDYEWSTTVPVPVDFVIYRIWHYFLAGAMPGRAQEPLLLAEGFSQDELKVFAQMEQCWQAFVRGKRVSLDTLHTMIAPPAVDVRAELMLHEAQRSMVYDGSLYYAADGVFAEDRKRETSLHADADGHFTAVISLEGLPAGTALRWDPLERRMCRIHIEKISCQSAVFVPINGTRRQTDAAQKEYDEFMTADPAYRIEGDLTGETQILLEGKLEIIYLDNRMQQFEQIRLERDTYYAEMERLREQIASIHRTKAYRIFKGLKRLVGRK